jgi:hypothetical protein
MLANDGRLRDGKLCRGNPAQVVLIEVSSGRQVRESVVIGSRA